MRKILKVVFWLMTAAACSLYFAGQWTIPVWAADFTDTLYARGAVLLDGDSGRVLYGKDEDVQMPMASTTKVMTCILALENCELDEVVQVSERAAAQPDVQLNMVTGEQYYLEDLLYSLMLKSHNDTAVAIAEHVGGSVEGFADMMNEKAGELGCWNTHFVTPNGLDDEDEGGVHSTTARDLATIMRYAIQNEMFLKITQTTEHSFTDIDNKRQFAVHNTNALLGTMDGLLSGKTGFTGDAGYCYVCAVRRDDRTFIVALLACGWPNNKTYKWRDTEKLIKYAFDQYHYSNVWQEKSYGALPVTEGIPVSGNLYETAYVNVGLTGDKKKNLNLLLRDEDKVEVEEKMKSSLKAPVREGEIIGKIIYRLNGEAVEEFPLVLTGTIEKINYSWCLQKIIHLFFTS